MSDEKEPYARGLVKKDPFTQVAQIDFEVVAVLDVAMENRDLEIIKEESRSIPRYGVIEFVVTDEEKTGPGSVVNSVAYLGFGSALNSGQVTVGRAVKIRDQKVGHVVGFNTDHAPNHICVVIAVKEKKTGHEFGLNLGDRITILGL